MSRLLLSAAALFFPLLAAASPGPITEAEARRDAKAWAQTDAAKALLAEYLTALESATTCEAGPCEIAAIKTQSWALRSLDEKENALPRPKFASLPGRPLLRLSVLASGRLAHAAAKTANPKAADYYALTDEAGSVRELEGVCLYDPPVCAPMRRLLEGVPPAWDAVNACVLPGPGCTFEEADALLLRASDALTEYLGLHDHPDAPTTKIFVRLEKVRSVAIFLYSRKSGSVVDELQAGSDAFEKDLAKPDDAAALGRLQAGGADLLEKHRKASIAADRLAYFLGYGKQRDDASHLVVRERVNLLEERLAGQRARALAVLTAKGLAPGPTEDGVTAGAGGTVSTGKKIATVAPVRTLLDRRLVPKTSGAGDEAPPILPGGFSTAALVRRLASSDPLERADARRRLGMTTTVGSPGVYSRAAFSQKGDESCAVAIQVQVLRAQGLLPPGDPQAQEDALMAEALAKGFRRGGTGPEYSGSLLAERGMIVTKHQNADWSQMESLLRRGGLAQVGVDADVLWNQEDSGPAGHSVLVTGAEISKTGNRILGVYINDSGTDPPGAGKFIPIETFQKAWKNRYTEIR